MFLCHRQLLGWSTLLAIIIVGDMVPPVLNCYADSTMEVNRFRSHRLSRINHAVC
ncbi:hypothetical protein BV25DRAFT_1831393 [Artomyces pyxidatus]|uniref:Uncharacterized protein n=1 Tax=Artomyces pyxidatus TaxID=48021 RepID=A0ACB8SM07_9AGAM|nr:hypothetical protein BV25DRAFT_1831393 [Artomyces pyxidatus]